MSKRKRNNPKAAIAKAPLVVQAVRTTHKKESNLMIVLEKVAPFLFKKKKIQKKAVVQPLKITKKTSTSKPRKHVRTVSIKIQGKKTPRTVRQTVATLERKKTVAKPIAKKAQQKPMFSGMFQKTPATKPAVDQKAVVSPKQELVLPKKPKGVFVLAEEQKKENEQAIASALKAESDSFLSKTVKTQPTLETQKTNGWSMLGQRFSFFGTKQKQGSSIAPEKLETKDIKQDSFLSRTQLKNVNAVVGTSMDAAELEKQNVLHKGNIAEETGTLEDFATSNKQADDGLPTAPVQKGRQDSAKAPTKGRILSAADLHKEAQEAKAASIRLEKEVAEIKEEMRADQNDRAANKAEKKAQKIAAKEQIAEAKKVAQAGKRKQYSHPGGFQKLLAGIGHIGLGKERMRFTQNLAMMLNAGLPLIDSIKTLQAETRTKPMKKLLQRMLDAVENGSPLWRAMEAESFFSLQALALVRIGEEAGSLAENVEYLARQDEKDHELKSKVKMAMIYPSIVMTIMFIIVIGLGWFVLPQLIGVLYSLNVPLPFVTRCVIAFTNMFTNYGAIVVPSFMGGCVLIVIIAKYTPLKGFFQWLMFHIPGIGALASEATIARFGVILGGLLKAGVPVIEAMQSLVDVTPIVAYRKLYIKMLDHIAIGDSFSKSFASIRGSKKLLPPSVQQLVITGEKSGALADIMLKIADIYDKKATETAQKLPVILEPMLLLFIGSLVGTIAFSIIVPIYSIVGNVGR